MIHRSALAVVAVALALAGCGDGRVNSRADAFWDRPVIDPAPYYTDCLQSDPNACPAPYECTIPDLAHDPTTDVCLVPCLTDRDCPLGNFCNGVDQTAEVGANRHCANDL